jgi:beta-N-acetylhexosaminidase
VVVVAVVLIATNAVAQRQTAGPHAGAATSTSRSDQATAAHHPGALSPRALPPGAVPPTVGLRPGATSPSAAGLLTAEETLPKLTTTQLAGQRVIYSYTGLTPPARLLSLIRAGDVAGVIFFSNNVSSPAQISSVAQELQQAAMSRSDPVHLPLLLMTDQEGGLVRRLSWAGPYLSEKQVGASANPSKAATRAGNQAGSGLHAVGLNVNLAPVLDVYRQAGNFIDQFGRSFSNNAGEVAKLGTLYVKAEQAHGVAGTVKHFPGLGAAATNEDTDLRPVTLHLSLSAIRNIDERPYKPAIAANVKLVMVSWAVYPALDARYPAGLSSTIVQGELRNRLGFGGVTITDALEAGALVSFGSIARRATLAARAGMDLLLCAAGSASEGESAMNSMAYDYTHGSLNKIAFKAAVERVLALRASLAKS